MNKSKTFKTASLAIGATLVGSMAVAPAVQADVNPFAISALASGYMLADKGSEGKCGEAKCGADKAARKAAEEMRDSEKMPEEGKCGANKAETKTMPEAKCGSNK